MLIKWLLNVSHREKGGPWKKRWPVLLCCVQDHGRHWTEDEHITTYVLWKCHRMEHNIVSLLHQLLFLLFGPSVHFNAIFFPVLGRIEKSADKTAEQLASPPSERGSETYTGWLGKLKKPVARIYEQDVRRFFHTCVRHLDVSWWVRLLPQGMQRHVCGWLITCWYMKLFNH